MATRCCVFYKGHFLKVSSLSAHIMPTLLNTRMDYSVIGYEINPLSVI